MPASVKADQAIQYPGGAGSAGSRLSCADERLTYHELATIN
jgi:hypothetical protein